MISAASTEIKLPELSLSTLYVANIPDNVPKSEVLKLFEKHKATAIRTPGSKKQKQRHGR